MCSRFFKGRLKKKKKRRPWFGARNAALSDLDIEIAVDIEREVVSSLLPTAKTDKSWTKGEEKLLGHASGLLRFNVAALSERHEIPAKRACHVCMDKNEPDNYIRISCQLTQVEALLI